MKNRFFSTYQKENCCLDHFGFKTPDDILFCPLYHYYKKPQFNNGFKVSGSSISNKIKDECWFYRNNIFESCNDHHRHHHDPNSKNLTVVETQKLNFKCLTDLTSDTPLNWKFNFWFWSHFYTSGEIKLNWIFELNFGAKIQIQKLTKKNHESLFTFCVEVKGKDFHEFSVFFEFSRRNYFSIFYLWQIGNSTVFLAFSKKCKVVKCLTFMCSKICNF